MNIVFAGTPDIAATILAGLLESEHKILSVLTQPDRPAGRGQKLLASPVKNLALQHHLPVYQPLKLHDPEIQNLLRKDRPDLMIVVAYGLIIPEAVLKIPALGCWNVHVSLLPRWRGAAPIQRALEAGDSETGVTLMQMDAGLDTGPILMQEKILIGEEMTAGELYGLLATKGRDLLLIGLRQQMKGSLKAIPQPLQGVTYACKIAKEEGKINWHEPASLIARKIRAFNPSPVAFAFYREHRIRIWAARVSPCQSDAIPGEIIYRKVEAVGIVTGAGILEIFEIQIPGGRKVALRDFLRGNHDFFRIGECLT